VSGERTPFSGSSGGGGGSTWHLAFLQCQRTGEGGEGREHFVPVTKLPLGEQTHP
jgi:hypothetical protein